MVVLVSTVIYLHVSRLGNSSSIAIVVRGDILAGRAIFVCAVVRREAEAPLLHPRGEPAGEERQTSLPRGTGKGEAQATQRHKDTRRDPETKDWVLRSAF